MSEVMEPWEEAESRVPARKAKMGVSHQLEVEMELAGYVRHKQRVERSRRDMVDVSALNQW